MKNYRMEGILKEAQQGKYAIGAFNIFNLTTARAAILAAEELQSPVIIQTSVSTVKRFNPPQLGKVLRVLEDQAGVPVIIHLDHCTDIGFAKECVDAGWDSVMIDYSKEPFEDNVNATRKMLQYARRRGVAVEGELGIIKGVEDDFVSEEHRTAQFAEVISFIEKTNVDLIAPSIGTAHGEYEGEPHLDFELLAQIVAQTDKPVVIHGGTGLSEDAFKKLIETGAAKINISTALKQCYINTFKKVLYEEGRHVNPLRVDKQIEDAVKEVVKYHIRLFGSHNKV